jgi:hypothetical protein
VSAIGLQESDDRLLEGEDPLLEGDDPLEDLRVAAEQFVVLLLAEIRLAGRVLEGEPIRLRRPIARQQDERRRVGGLGVEGRLSRMNGYESNLMRPARMPTLTAIQIETRTVWMTMNFQLPMKPVTRSATLAPNGASSTIFWLTG